MWTKGRKILFIIYKITASWLPISQRSKLAKLFRAFWAKRILRSAGVNINVEDCYAYGPGYYPHRKTVVKGKGDELPRTEGRHDLLSVVVYFASMNYPYTPSDIHFKNCVIENAREILCYNADGHVLQCGTHLGTLTLENVRFIDLNKTSRPMANKDEPLTVVMKNVSVEFADSSTDTEAFTLGENCYTTLTEE